MLEHKLRKWLKDLLGDDLDWIEPGRGGSVGMGDAMIHLPYDGRLPVELKVFEITTKGLRCQMRPAQIRYHYMTHHKGVGRTVIIYAIKAQVEENIFVFDGKYVPKDPYKHVVKDASVLITNYYDDIEPPVLFRSIVKAFNKEIHK